MGKAEKGIVTVQYIVVIARDKGIELTTLSKMAQDRD
jgi:hypothetical protein